MPLACEIERDDDRQRSEDECDRRRRRKLQGIDERDLTEENADRAQGGENPKVTPPDAEAPPAPAGDCGERHAGQPPAQRRVRKRREAVGHPETNGGEVEAPEQDCSEEQHFCRHSPQGAVS